MMAIYRNERFLFDDPFDRCAINRTTRYRLKRKRRQGQDQIAEPEESQSSSVLLSSDNSYEDEDLGSCEGDSITLPSTDDPQDEDSRALIAIYQETNNPNDCYYIQEDGDALMQYPDLEYEFEPPPLDLSDDESENLDAEPSPTGEVIYDGSPLTVATSALLIMKFKAKHKLSNEGLQDLLNLIKLHYPIPNKCIATSYLFNKQLGKNPGVSHYFCNSCFQTVDIDAEVCPNELCNSILSDSRSSFTEVPIIPQLKRLLNRQGVYDTVRERLNDSSTSQLCNDICGGKLYKELVSNYSRRLQHFVTLTFNTDGIPVFKSSKYAFWPMYLTVNELPYRMRIRKENMLFAGLWHGSIKPDMSLFLKPLTKSLQTLSTEGVDVIPYQSTQINCKAILLCCTCDLPAKAAVLNCVQFNGFYGCPRCTQKGKSVKCTSGGTVRVYPYDEQDPVGPKRTHKDTLVQAQRAMTENKNVFGVKGLSWLSAVPYFDIIRGTSVDYMHCILLGVCRHLLKLWTNKCNHSSSWYIGKDIKRLDKRLLLIKPPNEIQRTPRSLENTVKFWKAHELRAWLLHYSPVILNGILLSDYYQHHLLLVEGVYLLLKQVVSPEDIQQSFRLLKHYCFMFSALYGERQALPNVHGLLHLPESVSDLGPLWAHSCFPFESGNGEILKLFHGSQSVEKQVIDGVNTFVELPERAGNLLTPGSREHDLFHSMCAKGRHSRSRKIIITPTLAVIGQPRCMNLQHQEAAAFTSAGIHIPDHVFVYHHLLLMKKDRLITSESCSRATKRNNSCVVYESTRTSGVTCGILRKLVILKDSNGSEVCYGLLQTLRPASFELCHDAITDAKLGDHIVAFHPPRDGDLVVIAADCITDKAILLEVQAELNYIFVSLFPNYSEVE